MLTFTASTTACSSALSFLSTAHSIQEPSIHLKPFADSGRTAARPVLHSHNNSKSAVLACNRHTCTKLYAAVACCPTVHSWQQRNVLSTQCVHWVCYARLAVAPATQRPAHGTGSGHWQCVVCFARYAAVSAHFATAVIQQLRYSLCSLSSLATTSSTSSTSRLLLLWWWHLVQHKHCFSYSDFISIFQTQPFWRYRHWIACHNWTCFPWLAHCYYDAMLDLECVHVCACVMVVAVLLSDCCVLMRNRAIDGSSTDHEKRQW
jgi:hypothetical protein